MPDNLDQLNVSTKRYVRSRPKLVDNLFQNDPLAAFAKANLKEDFDGGRLIAENFWYGNLIGGAYAPGQNFDTSQPQIEQQAQFGIKFLEVGVTLSKEEIQVLNKGPQQIFSILDSRMNNAYITAGAFLSIAMYLQGQDAGYTLSVNGLTEALSDGTTNSWNGNTYPTYGGLTRNTSPIGPALNSKPTSVASLQYSTLEEVYTDACVGVGEFEPNKIITTFKGYSYLKEQFQTQQRFNDTQDGQFGFNAMKFNNAVVLKSRYAPGTFLNGTADPVAVTYLTQTSKGAVTAYPNSTGESLWILNARKPFFNFYMTNDEEYGLGFTGFKVAQQNTSIVGQILLAYNVTFNPRYHRLIYGFTA